MPSSRDQDPRYRKRGHVGEALVRTLRAQRADVRGVDQRPSCHTDIVGSIADEATVEAHMRDVSVCRDAATLQMPHVATHPGQAFVDTNVTGTLRLIRRVGE